MQRIMVTCEVSWSQLRTYGAETMPALVFLHIQLDVHYRDTANSVWF